MFSPKEVTLFTGFYYLCTHKNSHMIVILDPKTMNTSYYLSLIQACKYEKTLKYQTLKDKHLSHKGTKYKGLYIYRYNHSRL